jgi:hypothetical protein
MMGYLYFYFALPDMKPVITTCIFYFFAMAFAFGQKEVYTGERGTASFSSEAPLELIQAESKLLRGIVEPSSKAFAFTINISSFQGFNSDIQRTHFLENYMEQKDYPQATFKGKIIEDVDFHTPGTYSVRAKGELDIHGVKKERIIRGTLIVKDNSLHITTSFVVPVADHGIAIPKIVKQKIAEEIAVTIDMELVPGTKS